MGTVTLSPEQLLQHGCSPVMWVGQAVCANFCWVTDSHFHMESAVDRGGAEMTLNEVNAFLASVRR